MKNPRISFSAVRRVCSSQSGTLGSLSFCACGFFLLEHAKQAVLARFGVALRFLRLLHRLVEHGHQLRAPAQRIHGAALDQRFQHALVQQTQIDVLAEFDKST